MTVKASVLKLAVSCASGGSSGVLHQENQDLPEV
jgi:hypothetical protein